MKILLFAFSLVVSYDMLAYVSKFTNSRVCMVCDGLFDMRKFSIFNPDTSSRLKLKVFDLKQSIRERNEIKKSEEMRQNVFEKFLLSRANLTSLLKDFYPGRY
jgi:hypothetical protein